MAGISQEGPAVTRLISVHFPKASGSSFRRALTRAFSPEDLLFDDADDPADPDCLKWTAPSLYEAKKPDVLRALVVHGHFCPDKYDKLAGSRIVMLRHPVDTMVSLYYFWQHLADTPVRGHRLFEQFRSERPALPQFATVPAVRYLMSRTYFGGYDMSRFSAIGDYADRERYFSWIEHALGVRVESDIFDNVMAPTQERRRSDSDLSLRATLSAVLADDVAFFERWSGTFNDSPKAERVVRRSSWRDGGDARPASDDAFTQTADELARNVELSVRNADLNGALQTLIDGCLPLWRTTRAAGHIAASTRLDALCHEIGKAVFATMDLSGVPLQPSPRSRNAYLVTETYRAGGHGRVLEDLIAAHPERDHFVIWTSGENVSADEIPRRIRVDRAPTVYLLTGSPLEKLRRAFELTVSVRPYVLYHLGHPNDAVTVASMQRQVALRLVMINIADTSFALGRYLPNTVQVALGRHFRAYARDVFAVDMQLLPLSCRTDGPGRAGFPKPGDAFVTASAGAGHKFGAQGTASYADVLAARFTARGGRHIHFGDLHPDQLTSIQDRLAALGHENRFTHIEHVPRVSVALGEHAVDLYLDSYPVGGARANIEAMAAGLPICAAMHDPNLDGVSFCYPQCMTWTTIADLEQLLSSLDTVTLITHARLSHDYFVANHSSTVFRRRLDELIGTPYAV